MISSCFTEFLFKLHDLIGGSFKHTRVVFVIDGIAYNKNERNPDTENIFTSIKQIMKQTSYTENKVRQSLKFLEKNDYIKIKYPYLFDNKNIIIQYTEKLRLAIKDASNSL